MLFSFLCIFKIVVWYYNLIKDTDDINTFILKAAHTLLLFLRKELLFQWQFMQSEILSE